MKSAIFATFDLCDLDLGSGHTAYCHVSFILPTDQISFKSEKLFVDRRMDVETGCISLTQRKRPNNRLSHSTDHVKTKANVE